MKRGYIWAALVAAALGSARTDQKNKEQNSRLLALFLCEVAFVCESSDTNEITNIYYYCWISLDFLSTSSSGAQTEMLILSLASAPRHQSPAVCEGSPAIVTTIICSSVEN